MGRHHFPEPRPTAPAATRRRRTADDPAPTARLRRRVGGKVVTLAIGSVLAVGVVPGAVSTASVSEAPYAQEVGALSAWNQQKNGRNAEKPEPVGHANRASRPTA